MISAVVTCLPSKTPPLITRNGFSFWKFLRLFAAATESPFTKATAVGPERSASSTSTPASFAAILTSVFFATLYLVPTPSERRSALIEVTVKPRYSVTTVASADLKSSTNSATAAALSAFSSTVAGVASTRSFASLRPRLELSARTSLITAIFCEPASSMMTVNSS